MEDSQRVAELTREITELRRMLNDRNNNPMIKGLEDMTNNMKPQFDKLMEQMSGLKQLEPERMDNQPIAGRPCQITLTKGGVIVLNFNDREFSNIYFDMLRTRK